MELSKLNKKDENMLLHISKINLAIYFSWQHIKFPCQQSYLKCSQNIKGCS